MLIEKFTQCKHHIWSGWGASHVLRIKWNIWVFQGGIEKNGKTIFPLTQSYSIVYGVWRGVAGRQAQDDREERKNYNFIWPSYRHIIIIRR